MGFEQKLIYFNSIYKITVQAPKRTMRADNEEEVSESFSFAFYF